MPQFNSTLPQFMYDCNQDLKFINGYFFQSLTLLPIIDTIKTLWLCLKIVY